MAELLAPGYVVLSLFILVWDVFLAGQIARLRTTPPGLAAVTALIGLLAAPAVAVALATSSIITARAVIAVAWVVPLTAVVIAGQALYATARRLVTPLVGVPIMLYDIAVAAAAVVRTAELLGLQLAGPLLTPLASERGVLAVLTGGAALASPLLVAVPIVAPAFPARWRASRTVRTTIAGYAAAWIVLWGLELPRAARAVASYARYDAERLQERPAGDFAVGLRLLPVVDAPPSPIAVASDLALADTTGADAIELVIVPGATNAALDSVARSIGELRRDTTTILVALGGDESVLDIAHSRRPRPRQWLGDVDRSVRRLAPDIFIPLFPPLAGTPARAPAAFAEVRPLVVAAARAAHAADSRVRIGVVVNPGEARDSIVYAWAAGGGSPVDVVGFVVFPGRDGARSQDRALRTADRWMRAAASTKDHWVLAAGGLPAAHGVRSQSRALWGTLAWATSRAAIKGLVVADAGDYARTIGLRGPTQRLRPATAAMMRAISSLKEAVAKSP